MLEHYKSEQHQNAIIEFIRRFISKQMTSDQHERGASEMDIDTLPHSTTSSSDITVSQLREVCETIDILAGGTQTINEDVHRLHDESAQLQTAIEAL